MSASSPLPSRRVLLLAAGAITLLLLVQMLPDLGRGDLFREEGRRVIPAREMLASGDWIVPTIWRTPYLAKPPGVYWILAIAFELAGVVTELTARLPSLLATLATSLGLLWVGARLFTWRAGVFGALLFTLSIEALSKGRLAEIEAPLAFFVFAAVCAWWLGRGGSWAWTLLSGVSLAMALFLKGPAGLLFFVGPPLALAVRERSARELFSPRLWVPVLVAVALFGAWVAALFGQLGRETVVATWSGEAMRATTVIDFLEQRANFLFGSALAFFPVSFVVLFALGTPSWKRLRESPNARFAFWAGAAGWLFFLVFPGTEVRYAYPTLPFAALLAGALFAEVFDAERTSAIVGRLSKASCVLAALSLVIPPLAVVGAFVPLGEVTIDEWGLVVAAAMGALAVFVLRARQARWRIFGAFVVLPLLVGQVLVHQVGAATARRHQRAHLAHELDQTVPPGEPLYVGFWLNFCALSYVDHEIRYAPRFGELPPDSWLLLTDEQLAEARAKGKGPGGFEEVYRREFWGGERVLVRVRDIP